MGKVVTIFYAILGIPLMLLCLSNIGDVMASSFRFLYWRIFCYMCTRKPKKKHRHRSSSRQGSRSVRGRSQSVKRRARAALPRAHSDTDYRYKDDNYVSPAASRRAGGSRGERRPLRSQSHTPGGHLEVPNWGNRDLRRSPSNRSPAQKNAYEDKSGKIDSRLAMPLDDINDDIYGLNPPKRRKARPGNLRSRSLPRPRRVELNPTGKRFFSDKGYPRPNPRNYDQDFYPQRQSDYDMRDNEFFPIETDKEHDVTRNVEERAIFDRYGTGGRGRRLDRVVSMDPEYYDYDREDNDMAYGGNRGRRAMSHNDYRETEYDDDDFEPRRRCGRYAKQEFRNYHNNSQDHIPGLDDFDIGQWRSRGPLQRDDSVDRECQRGNPIPQTERLPRFKRSPRNDYITHSELLTHDDRLTRGDRLTHDDRLTRGDRLTHGDRSTHGDRFRHGDHGDDEFEEGMPHVVECWSEDEEIGDFFHPYDVRRLQPTNKAAASPRMMTPQGLRVSPLRQTRARTEEPLTLGITSYTGTISDYPASYKKEQIKPVPIWLCVCLVISYIIAGAFLFHNWEGWPVLDSAYFCFITLTTIGFGDYVPASHGKHPELRIGLCSLYLLFGISLLAMSFNLVQEQVIANIKSVAKKLGIIKPKQGEESDDELNIS